MNRDPAPEFAAILTGDLIGSTEAGPQAMEKAMAVLADAADGISGWMPRADTRFTRHRGDGWQIYIAEPGLGLRAALTLNARLRAADVDLATRTAIGIGKTDSLGSDSLADARGPAFEASGHALDAMGRTRRLAIAGDGITGLHDAVVDLLDERSTRWTMQQAEATALYLHPDNPTLTDIAPQLGISTQAVNYRLSGAGATAIRRTLRAWEEDFELRDTPTGAADA